MSNKGMTLTELIVSSILVGIVMVGIASFSSAIKQIQTTNEKSTLLEIRTAAAINHIRRSAVQAVGYQDDPGIITSATGASPAYFSFRQDRNNTPNNFSDDTWVIYSDGGIAGRMYTCTQDATAGPVPNSGIGGGCAIATNLTLLQNISTISYSRVTDDASSNLNLYFEINLTTMDDISKPYHPVNNPKYTVNTRIIPPSHSW